MADPTAVKRALRALVADVTGPAGPADPDRTVERAATAVADVERAATFLDRQGTESLADAIEAAERRGDRKRARRGQRALAAFERFRRAAGGDGSPTESL